MSLSDKNLNMNENPSPETVRPSGGESSPSRTPGTDDFTPIDVGALDSFDQEVSLKPEDAQPDLDRFKMLFDPKDFVEEGPISFEALFSFSKEEAENGFEPLIEGTGKPEETQAPEAEPEKDVPGKDAVPEKSAEELGYEKGLAQGLIQGEKRGLEIGEAKGFDQGFAKGQAQGLEQGKAEGLEQGKALGLEQGMAQGLEQAQAQVKVEAEQIIAPLKESLEKSDQLLDRLIDRYEPSIVELIFKIASKAVAAHIKLSDDAVRDTILDALKSLVAPEEIALSVSTEDYEYVEMVKDEFFEAVQSLKHVAVSSDPMIAKGGCRIETATATITTDPEIKLAAIYDAMVKAGKP